jgi:hypothetical protein
MNTALGYDSAARHEVGQLLSLMLADEFMPAELLALHEAMIEQLRSDSPAYAARFHPASIGANANRFDVGSVDSGNRLTPASDSFAVNRVLATTMV